MLTDGSLLISSSEYKLIWAQQLLSLTLSLEIRNQSGLVRPDDKNNFFSLPKFTFSLHQSRV